VKDNAMEPRQQIQKLVAKYKSLTQRERRDYNEANTKNVFIQPLFGALGWDFSDMNQVEAEKTIVRGRVDFVFKVNRVSKFCLEVKPLREELTDDYRKQAISYAYNKGVTWAVLTNFDRLQVFNAERQTPDLNSVLALNLSCNDYITYFDDLCLLSREMVIDNALERVAERYGRLARRIPIEKRLYQHLRESREKLFNEIYKFHHERAVTLEDTDRLIQELFNRLLFIRTAEDRELAGNHPLLATLHQWQQDRGVELIERLRHIFEQFAQLYDSDLFPSMMDPWQQIWVSNDLLAETIKGLYDVPGDFARYDFAAIDADVLGQVYEQYLGYIAQVAKEEAKRLQRSLFPETERIEITAKREKRKAAGIYYTPKWVTDYIVRQTVGRFIEERDHNEILNVKILDPACGSGSFLIRAYDELLNYHAHVKSKTVAELDWSERMGILTRNIFGVDLDLQAVKIAQLNLLLRALAERKSLPSLDQNVQRGDSLISGDDEELQRCLGDNFMEKQPFNWDERFADVVKQGGFDIVIGNPPYVMELRENKELFRVLQATPLGQIYYEPKMDIFYFFIERGLDLLKPNGYLGFIVQEYWVSRTHASKLRRKVFDETIPLVLADFNEFQVFKDAPGQHNMVIVLKKTKDEKDETLILNLKSSELPEQEIIKALASDAKDQSVFEARAADPSRLYDTKTDKVYVKSNIASDILIKLSENSFNPDDGEIQQGLVTPQHYLTTKALSQLTDASRHKAGEGIFVLSKAELQSFTLTEAEQSLLRPFHYAEEVDRYYYKPVVERYLIYTPKDVAKDIELHPDKYPSIMSHLDKYQPVITSDNKPYGIHRARQPEWFEDKKKIIGVRKTRYPKFVVVPEPWYGDQSVLIIRLTKHKGLSPYFLTAILNSKIGHFWLFQQKRHGGQLQIDKEVLLNFPIPSIDLSKPNDKQIHNELAALVKKMIKLKRELAESKERAEDIFGDKSRQLESQIEKAAQRIDELVYQLYGLTSKEIEKIEASLAMIPY
jgi:adenine-specific DNA-methyltransferase